MTTKTTAGAAESSPVGANGVGRGQEIARRRSDLGINSASALADKAGMDRKTVARAEQGVASENTYLRLESWLSRQESERRPVREGAAMAAVHEEEPTDPDRIRVNIVGPHADWKVCVEGSRDDAAELTEMAAELAARLRAGDPPP